MLNRRTLGAPDNEASVSCIGLGCMAMSEFYGASDEDEAIKVIHRALDLGMTFLDTADMYGRGHNETLVGRAVRDRRAQAFIATKFGIVRDDAGGRGVSGKPDYVRAACDASLSRLGVSTIDLYYQHRVDPEVPIEDTVGAMGELVAAGKVRHIGLSEAAPETLRRAVAVHPVSALQTEYSLWSRDPERELLALCDELNVTFVAYSPLGRGFLTGRFRSPEDLPEDDWRRHNPRFEGDNFRRNLALVEKLEAIASERGCTPAQLALAWLLHQGEHIVPIPGTRSIERLEQNAAAADIRLKPDELAEIEAAFPFDAAAGTRYPEAQMTWVNR